jgi:hypothetical protein
MQAEFLEKLARVRAEAQSDILLRLTPAVMKMPLPIRRYDDPFLPFGKAVIRATRDRVCGYVFDLASYLRIGAAGAIALERTLSLIAGERLAILRGPFSGEHFAEISDENAFECDAVTLTTGAHLHAYLKRSDRAAFIEADEAPNEDNLRAMPHRAGLYLSHNRQMMIQDTHRQVVTLWVAGEDVLYAGSGDDFTEDLRQALQQMKESIDHA